MDDRQTIATAAAVLVRNSLENLHAEQAVMNDATMPEINRLVRDSIYTVLDLLWRASHGDDRALRDLAELDMLVPDYWEEPQICPGYEAR